MTQSSGHPGGGSGRWVWERWWSGVVVGGLGIGGGGAEFHFAVDESDESGEGVDLHFAHGAGAVFFNSFDTQSERN